jgi:hypothetical protein
MRRPFQLLERVAVAGELAEVERDLDDFGRVVARGDQEQRSFGQIVIDPGDRASARTRSTVTSIGYSGGAASRR